MGDRLRECGPVDKWLAFFDTHNNQFQRLVRGSSSNERTHTTIRKRHFATPELLEAVVGNAGSLTVCDEITLANLLMLIALVVTRCRKGLPFARRVSVRMIDETRIEPLPVVLVVLSLYAPLPIQWILQLPCETADLPRLARLASRLQRPRNLSQVYVLSSGLDFRDASDLPCNYGSLDDLAILTPPPDPELPEALPAEPSRAAQDAEPPPLPEAAAPSESAAPAAPSEPEAASASPPALPPPPPLLAIDRATANLMALADVLSPTPPMPLLAQRPLKRPRETAESIDFLALHPAVFPGKFTRELNLLTQVYECLVLASQGNK